MLIQITTRLAILGALYVASGRALAANILWSTMESNHRDIAYALDPGEFSQGTRCFMSFDVSKM